MKTPSSVLVVGASAGGLAVAEALRHFALETAPLLNPSRARRHKQRLVGWTEWAL